MALKWTVDPHATKMQVKYPMTIAQRNYLLRRGIKEIDLFTLNRISASWLISELDVWSTRITGLREWLDRGGGNDG